VRSSSERVLIILFALVLAASPVYRGLCFMGTGTGAHDCCRSDSASVRPVCCHSGPTSGMAAVASASPVVPAVSFVSVGFPMPLLQAAGRAVPALTHTISPPRTLLRI
jgi:hypothetical protein